MYEPISHRPLTRKPRPLSPKAVKEPCFVDGIWTSYIDVGRDIERGLGVVFPAAIHEQDDFLKVVRPQKPVRIPFPQNVIASPCPRGICRQQGGVLKTRRKAVTSEVDVQASADVPPSSCLQIPVSDV